MKIIFIPFIAGLSLMGLSLVRNQHQQLGDIAATVSLPGEMPVDSTSRLNGQWFLLAVLPSDTVSGKLAGISFDIKKSSFTGNTGCNTMRGSFRLLGKGLQFDANIITTKMVCVGYNEAAFLKNLLLTDGYKLENGILILLNGTTELSKWTRKPSPAPKVNRT